MMRYMYIVPTFCILSTILLYAQTGSLSSILQKSGEKKILLNPPSKKKKPKKKTFVFTDKYDFNGIGSEDKNKKKSEQYEYKNKSKFKFKFNSGSEYNNVTGRHSTMPSGGAGSSLGSAGGSQGGGGRR